MENNIYIRSNKSIKTITLTKILFLLPLIIYGFYKNGIYLYKEHYITFIEIFRPLIYVFIGASVGILTNIIYERLVHKNKSDIDSIIYSSFHLEYGIIIGCLVSINTNVLIYTLCISAIFFISKFFNNRINIMCFALIAIYLIDGSSFLNINEMSKTFSREFMDYLIGRYPGGVASTHVILIILGVFGLYITNNIKADISVSALLTAFILFGAYSLISDSNFANIFFSNNLVMLYSFVATDTKTSCYTRKGMIFFGVLIGVLTFLLYFISPTISPVASILIVSLFNNLIDRKVNSLQKA